MQYENNPANGFRDIVRKRNTDARPHARHGDGQEIKKHNNVLINMTNVHLCVLVGSSHFYDKW